MKTSIATVSISGDLREKLAAIAAAGFDGVEIFETDFLTFDGGPREVGAMVRDHGLDITLFQPFRDFEGMPGELRKRAFDRAELKFDLMEQLGTSLMLVCSNVSPNALGGIDRAADDFRELGERAKKRGLRVGYEALAWGRFVNDHRDAWEIVRRASHPNIGIILDSFHTLARKIDPDSIRAIPHDKIFIVQLADAPVIEMDLLQWSRHLRNMPGQGDLPVKDFMQAVAATGYDGALSLEIFNDQFRGGSPRSIAVDGRRSLVYLMDRVRRETADIAIEVPAMPPRVPVHGVEFVEFTADEHEAVEIGALLETMGFAKAGRHKSKDVTHYRQGDINLVINSEHEGFAQASRATHGATAYAIGLKVEDTKASVERARVLGAELFQQPPAPGEAALPAIKGIGDGIIYFFDNSPELADIWRNEFTPVAASNQATDGGLVTIDHVAQTMRYDEMLTWLLFYTSIFAVDKTPMVDIVDPAGLVRSQAIENGERSLRLTMNGAENDRTLAGHFISESVGSGVQHLAFSTGDIFATAQALKVRGFVPLAISANYYDDVKARFGLDDGFIARIKALNILYDRDSGGEFFQFYSRNYRAGFFFEVLQRRGYQGYGAANAPFRIAAQQRLLRAQTKAA